MVETSVIDIGPGKFAPNDARAWIYGCKVKKIASIKHSIIERQPTIDNLLKFFSTPVELLFFGGHSYSFKKKWYLSNYYDEKIVPKRVISTIFLKDHIVIRENGKELIKLYKNKSTDYNGKKWKFRLHEKSNKYIIWNGCSLGGYKNELSDVHTLFNKPVILCYNNLTSSEITSMALTGNETWSKKNGIHNKSFFGEYDSNKMGEKEVRNLWLEMGWRIWYKNEFGYDYMLEKETFSKKLWRRFCSVDRAGRRYWMIKRGKPTTFTW